MLDCKASASAGNAAASRKDAASPTKAQVQQFRDWFERMLKSEAKTRLRIEPWQAEVMLETNTGNRTLSLVRAQRYGQDMKTAKWQVTGEPIIFSDAGILNDGQTRLKACVLAGVSFETDVTFGIARRAFRVTGVGAKRTLADVLSIAGETNTTNLAGALNWLNRYRLGLSAPTLSHEDGLQLLENDPDIRRSVIPGKMLSGKTHLIDPSLAVFLHYIFALKDSDRADAFFGFLTEGVVSAGTVPISGGRDPRHKLRERLILNKGEKAKLPNIEIAAIGIKAWNAHCLGKDIAYLRWQTSEAAGAEPFPKVA